MKLKIFSGLIIPILLIFVSTCGRKMPLPTVEPTPDAFGANDTSYIHLNPVWQASTLNYHASNEFTPADIAIGEDEYLFVADQANDQVLVLAKSGTVLSGNNLNKIKPVPHPVALDIDAKLNLLIVNGTNKIYGWNQYLNTVGVDSILERAEGNRLLFEYNPARVDSLLGVHFFYEDPDPASQFQGVAFGPAGENTLFVTDNGNNRILKLQLIYSGAVVLKNGWRFPTFAAVFEKDIATYGSGAGTVDNPRQITADDNGNIYFTQLGGNFLVQKLAPKGDVYESVYTLYEDAIMDLNRFAGPCDIALGKSDAIFVLDTASGSIFKFENKGTRAGKLANLGKKGLTEAVFQQALGLALSDDEVVFIAESGRHQIERYQYSVSESDLPPEQP